MSFIYQNLTPFGIEIARIDIRTVANPFILELKCLLSEHGVAVIRNQPISDAEFVNFLKALGPLTFTAGEKPLPQQPWLNVVSNVGRSSPPRSVFHTDTSYVTQPPAYTALKAVTLPQSGGETLISNQYHAYKTLPVQVKQQLANAQVLHVASGVTLTPDQERQSWHPLFRRHPISGQTSLYLSTPERCQTVAGFDFETSQRILRLLYKHSLRPNRIYSHTWHSDDIVIWDNRCTMHRADHSRVVGDRIFHRGLVKGEVPIASAIAIPNSSSTAMPDA